MDVDAVNTDSVDCVRLPFPFPHRPLKPGEFCWQPDDSEPEKRSDSGDGIEGKSEQETRYLYICFPGDNYSVALRCFKGPDRGIEREWGWDGNEDKPTLQPSLLNPGEWHGHLKQGRLESCP